MAFRKITAQLSYSSLVFLKKVYNFLDAVLSGFWLGVLSEKTLDLYVELHYDQSAKYFDDRYNLSGLHGWEKEMIGKHFSKAKSILLLAAGAGRETAALNRMGFEVDSYECNKSLIESGNMFLRKNKTDAAIRYLPVNSVPAEIKKYDGIIIGWGAYIHIRGSKKRISFLKELHPFLNEGSPLIISFLTREEGGSQDTIVKNVSNFFKFFRGKDKTEPGDRLMSYFAHFFTEKEIRYELSEADLRLIEYYNIDYGCAIAMI